MLAYFEILDIRCHESASGITPSYEQECSTNHHHFDLTILLRLRGFLEPIALLFVVCIFIKKGSIFFASIVIST